MSAWDGPARRSVVRISAPGGGYERSGTGFWGSGFFIAPGWVLTCAHVVGNGGGGVLGGSTAIDITDADERTVQGRVALVLPGPADPDAPPRRWPLPDLALVEVADADGADCLWLSDRSTIVPAPVSLHGWSLETGELALRFGVGIAAGGDGTEGNAMLLRGEIPVAGCSGGPVVDTARGAVIGMSKGRGKDTAGLAVPITALRRIADDAPGRSLLHSVVRAHDRHHLRRYRTLGMRSWTGLQQDHRPHAADSFTPVLRAHLFARLAELPPPGTPAEVMALVDRAKRRVIQGPYQPGVEHDPRSWREGVGLLYDVRAGDDADGRDPGRGPGRDLELEAVLLYTALVVAELGRPGRPGPAVDGQMLRDVGTWLENHAEPLTDVIRWEIDDILHGGAPDGPDGPVPFRRPRPDAVDLDKRPSRPVAPAATPARARADVIVEVDDVLYGTRYPWRVKLLLEDDLVTPLKFDEEGVPRALLREALREPIAEALSLGDVGEHLAALHVVLPRELFDEPLDTWQLTPPGRAASGIDPHTMPLGQRRVVVVRDRRRRDFPAIPEWRRRWKAAAAGPLTAVSLRKEVPEPGHDSPRRETGHATYRRLSFVADTAVPVYCGEAAAGAGAAAMEAALAAGHAVAIWRRCAPDHRDCADFHDQVSRLVSEAGTAEGLPHRIRELRIACGDPDEIDPGARWAQSIALLLDSPDHPPLPDTPLYAPGTWPGVS
ncbi:serine protease [Streptomyces sp. ET3-23]|uniref:VMAP-C domain-containing protein n=1 Tax=Streptomyces sp. ET3-23 TaxID=2885643 RepID=UPI001D108616|nr:trypsin-like peptidase domain-containing protein [Streptomyces sp. ET3-23]MCC2277647.1 serine protease [Streptomyces sp. ET3-23]